MSFISYQTDPVSSVSTIDDSLSVGRSVFEEMLKRKCYKVTITFNRKYWKKARAFMHSYVVIQKMLDDVDVYQGMFFMELHKDSWPHIHGFINWENEFFESPDNLRNNLVNRFGQTKIFEYKPEDYLKSKNEEEIKYENWFEYIKKDFVEMKNFREKVNQKFQISMIYEKIEKERFEEVEEMSSIEKYFLK